MDQQTLIYAIIATIIFILLGGSVYYLMKQKTENFDNLDDTTVVTGYFVYNYNGNNGWVYIFNDLKGNMYFKYRNNSLSKDVPLVIKTKSGYAFDYDTDGKTIIYTLAGFPGDTKTHTFKVNNENKTMLIDGNPDKLYKKNDNNYIYETRFNIVPFNQNINITINNENLESKFPYYKWCYIQYDSNSNKWLLYNAKQNEEYKENTNFYILNSVWLGDNVFELNMMVCVDSTCDVSKSTAFMIKLMIDTKSGSVLSPNVKIDSFEFQ